MSAHTLGRKACFLCSTVATWHGGKAYAPHRCPHGKPCISGSKFTGHGFVHSPLGGPYYCADCAPLTPRAALKQAGR